MCGMVVERSGSSPPPEEKLKAWETKLLRVDRRVVIGGILPDGSFHC